MIFLANFLVLKNKSIPLFWSWAALVPALVLNYLFPMNLFFSLSTASRVLVSFLLVGTPVFFAATCFSYLFSKQSETGYALGVNMIGAMAGGLI
jgi:hypothetical protein